MSYVDAGYALVAAALAAYAGWVLRRHRLLARTLPPEAPVVPGDQWP